MAHTEKNTKEHSSKHIGKFIGASAGAILAGYLISLGITSLNNANAGQNTLFGFEIVVGGMLLIVCGLVAIAITYFNYKWVD